MGRTVRASMIEVGDVIYTYSRKRTMPSEARVTAIHRLGESIRFDTPGGNVTVPKGASVDVPAVRRKI